MRRPRRVPSFSLPFSLRLFPFVSLCPFLFAPFGRLRRVRGGAGSGGLPAPLKILRAKIPRQSRRFAMRRLSPAAV